MTVRRRKPIDVTLAAEEHAALEAISRDYEAMRAHVIGAALEVLSTLPAARVARAIDRARERAKR